MLIDFAKIELMDLEGNISYIDLSKVFGNLVFKSTTDVAEFDLAKKIYYEGAVELNKDQAGGLLRYVDSFQTILVRESIKKVLSDINN